ncbi:MAG TPA: hypothetical protein VJR27_02715 [Candidatus Saccharimonadales bacterium]|nr:hypothetical protein [Candidatus Saccharimonadales bacterium]
MSRKTPEQPYWNIPLIDGGDTLPFSIGNEPVTYDELFAVYAKSSFGQHHAKQALRWPEYGVSDRGLQKALGASAHPLGHMRILHNTAFKIASRENEVPSPLQLTIPEFDILRAGMLLHDIGKNNDPALGQGTDEQKVRNLFWSNKYKFVSEDFMARMEKVIAGEDNASPLGKAAEATQTFDAYQSAVMAYHASTEARGLSKGDREGLHDLALEVATGLEKEALPAAMDFDYVDELVNVMSVTMEQARLKL